MNDPRATAAPTAVALGVVLLIGALRLWLPASLEAGVEGAIEVGLLVLAPLLVAFVVAPALTVFVGPRRLLLGSAGLLGFGRLILQPLAAHPTNARMAVAIVVVAAAAAWLGAVAAGEMDRRSASIGLAAGVAIDVVLHAGLGTVDAIWRDDATGWLVVIVLVVGFLATTWLGRGTEDPGHRSASPWLWLVAGPFLALHLLVATGPHLTAIGGLGPRVALALLVVAHAIAVGAASSLTSVPSRGIAFGAAGLLLLGLAARLATQMPFETPFVHALATVTIIITAAICVAALGSSDRGRSPASNAGATLAGLAFAVIIVLAHEAQLVDQIAGHGVWIAAVAVAALGTAALRTSLGPPATAELGHPAIPVALLLLVLGLGGTIAETLRSVGDTGTTGAQLILVHHHVDTATGAELAHALGSSLAAREPEVVTLTQVPRGSLTSGGVDPVARIAPRLGLSPLVTRTDRLLRGDVILGRAATTETRVEPLPGGGTVLVAVLALHPQEVAVVTASLPADVGGEIRAEQVRRVASIVVDLERLQLPAVLTGTFWRPPDAPELQPLRDRIRSLSARGVPTPTWPAHSPRVAMDQIYVSEGLVTGDLVVGPATVGSHLPVAVGVRVSAEP